MRNLRNEVRRIVQEELSHRPNQVRSSSIRNLVNENQNVDLATKLLNPDMYVITRRDLNVIGDLNLNDSPIRSLPKGLRVTGSLYLNNSQIMSLPKGLRVGRNLGLYNTPIQYLPDGLVVGGWLDASHSQLKTLPYGLKVTGNFEAVKADLRIPEFYIKTTVEKKGGYINGKVITRSLY